MGDDVRVQAAAPVTIGMPVFNSEPYVAAALESILAQTFVDFVLVVSDNASTDATGEIVRAYARDDRRIRYLRSPVNQGAAWNFNRAFAECGSPYFKWAASDDLLAPSCVERCLEALSGAPSDTVVAVAPHARWIGPDGAVLGDVDDRMNVRHATPHARLRHVVENVVWGNTIFGLIVSRALRSTRGIGNYPSSDLVLMVELSLLGQLWMIPEPLFFRREHNARSRRAHSTLAELTQWHDPQNERPSNEFRRVFREDLAAINLGRLPPVERALCYQSLVAAWMTRYGGLGARLRRLVSREGHVEAESS